MDPKLILEIRILIAIATKMVRRAWEKQLALSDSGVSFLQFMIMAALSHGDHTISELGQHFLLDPSTLVPAVDTLERRGLVERGHDPQDRRRVPLSLTEEGVSFIVRLHRFDKTDPFIVSLEALGAERAQQLREILLELVSEMPEGEEAILAMQTRVQSHLPFFRNSSA